tara:strand:+ start:1230 stop:1694 length:465 start_codon:yes stop_codon:yes gene_type:complete
MENTMKNNREYIKILENLLRNRKQAKDSNAARDVKILEAKLEEAKFQPRVGVTGMIDGTNGNRNAIDIEFIRKTFEVLDGEVYHIASKKLATWNMKVSKDGEMEKKHVTIDTKYFNAHRIVYAWYHGVDIDNVDISHIDGDYMNNNIDNLVIKS